MLSIRTIALISLLAFAVTAGCSSSDQAAIDQAVSATFSAQEAIDRAVRETVEAATHVPTATPTPVPTATPTSVPTATPTSVPTATPTSVPTATLTPVPTATPTPVPTATPTPVPTATPTPVPLPETIIAFSSDRFHDGHFGTRQIYVMEGDGSNQTAITNGEAQSFAPVWVDPGISIAFYGIHTMLGWTDSRAWIVNSDGTGRATYDSEIELEDWWDTHFQTYGLSPDGTMEVFVLENGDTSEIWIGEPVIEENIAKPKRGGWIEDETGRIIAINPTQLTANLDAADHHPSWSPVENKIAFQSNRDGDWEIYVIDVDTGELQKLTDNNAQDEHPAWSIAVQ